MDETEGPLMVAPLPSGGAAGDGAVATSVASVVSMISVISVVCGG